MLKSDGRHSSVWSRMVIIVFSFATLLLWSITVFMFISSGCMAHLQCKQLVFVKKCEMNIV